MKETSCSSFLYEDSSQWLWLPRKYSFMWETEGNSFSVTVIYWSYSPPYSELFLSWDFKIACKCNAPDLAKYHWFCRVVNAKKKYLRAVAKGNQLKFQSVPQTMVIIWVKHLHCFYLFETWYGHYEMSLYDYELHGEIFLLFFLETLTA